MCGKRKYTVQNLYANYVHDFLEIQNKYAKKGIHLVEKINRDYFNNLEHRDAYYNIVNRINSRKDLGHAICLVGLRRTGKSVILNQLHANSQAFDIKQEEIVHITLSVVTNEKTITRDSMNIKKLNNIKEIEYPELADLQEFIQYLKSHKEVKCIMIDEITLCKDFILAGKGFIDSLVDSGTIVILAGTESVSFNLANENSLYSRLILEDISYIPFGEYCRVKRIPISTQEDKQKALDRYIEHGNILDETIDIDEKYIESALGINVALSIINSDYEEFIGCEDNIKELVQSIIKYFKLIGEQITVQNIKSSITRADISRAIKNENRRRIDSGAELINVQKEKRNQLAVAGAEEVFSQFSLELGLSKIQLSREQLLRIDELFTKMGLLYNLSIIPEITTLTGAVEADDICILHALSISIMNGVVNKLLITPIGISDEDVEILAREIRSALKGRILENIITLQYIKALEKEKELLTCIRNYQNNAFQTERKCTKHRLYKYNNKIMLGDSSVKAEIDIVMSEEDVIKLIEIKKSTEVVEEQTRWLNNDIVINEIKSKISQTKDIFKYVYYMGENTCVEDVQYKNIVDVLIEHYNANFKSA